MYEINGITCSGKSYYLKSLSEKENLRIFEKKFYHFFFGMYFFCASSNIVQIKFIFLNSWFSDSRFIYKIKVFYNVIIKFYYLNCSNDCIVDEGFLQIPYILLLNDQNMNVFFSIFADEISSINFFWIYADDNLVQNRILERGHHRFNGMNNDFIITFIRKNLIVQYNYFRYFESYKTKGHFINEYK